MRYLVLLYDDEANGAEPGTPAFDAELAAFRAFEKLADETIVGGEALEPVATARTIRHDGGVVDVTDGPFAETAEILGGFYVLESPTLDDTIELVRHIPTVDSGTIEVRPLVEWVEGPGSGEPVTGGSGQAAGDGRRRALVTIHGPETDEELPGTLGWEAGVAEHGRFGESAGRNLLTAAAVHPSSTATTVARRDGELLVTDGPFAETIEIVGGLYILGGTDEEIMDLARAVPTPEGGWLEVRPILELDG